jgi:uncharacterized membrane protein YeaQ/YmgE (transglycosylase-associated protein family)
MDIYTALNYVILGALLGAAGQSARVIVGLKKLYESLKEKKEFKDEFCGAQLIISLVIGAIAGTLGAVAMMGQPVDKKLLLGLVAVGYAGADFIEGFMQTVLPKRGPSSGGTPTSPGS